MSPVACAGALAAVKYLKDHNEIRVKHQERAQRLKELLKENDLPLMKCASTHIVPVLVGEAKRCKSMSDELLNEHNIFIQPINYPTVDVGTERLRIAPTPYHDDAMMSDLVVALTSVYRQARA
jgi:5-aminolevulinate synthase